MGAGPAGTALTSPCLQSITPQRLWRGYTARTTYLEQRRLIMAVQSMFRGRNARQRLTQLRRVRAAITIQKRWRGFQARRDYQQTRKAAIAIQSAHRVKVARKALRSLRQQAREGTKLLEDKKALETKVAELQSMLETVQNQRNELRQQVRDSLWCYAFIVHLLCYAYRFGGGQGLQVWGGIGRPACRLSAAAMRCMESQWAWRGHV